MIYTLTLNPAIDERIELESFNAGGVSKLVRAVRSIGGKGVNVARTLSILGCAHESLALVGEESAPFFREEAARENIHLRLCTHPGATRISQTLVFMHECVNTHIRRPASLPSAQNACAAAREYLGKVLTKGDYLVLSGSLPDNLPSNTWGDFIRLAHERESLALLDSSGEALEEGLAARPFLLKINIDEFIDLSEQSSEDRADFRKTVTDFHKSGVSVIVITMGEGGALLSDGENFYHARLELPQEGRGQAYVTGCGDAFSGAFLSSLISEKSLPECLCFGVAASGASTLHPETAFFTLEKAEEFVSSVVLRREFEAGGRT
jgi:1-phosphofructokinase family hexose kinase